MHHKHILLSLLTTSLVCSTSKAQCPANKEVAGDLILRLPFLPGQQYDVSQGYCGTSHGGYQVDFLMPSNTVVVAAAAGIVAEVGSNSTNSASTTGNPTLDGGIFVKLRHQGRAYTWYSSYLHLSSRLVQTNETVAAGQIIGYSGNTGYATGPNGGFHLHFHVRNAPSGDVNGFRPTPMQGLELQTGANPITNFVAGNTYIAVNPTNIPLTLDASHAVQIQWHAKDGYSYQVFGTANMVDWLPVGDRLTGQGGWLSFSANAEGNPQQVFRIQEYPPDPTTRLVNLSEFRLDAATVDSQTASMTIYNMRAQSANSTIDDYLQASFIFDYGRQAFQMQSFKQIQNVGLFVSPYFAKDVPATVTITNAAGGTLLMNTLISGTAYPTNVLFLPLQTGQVISFHFQSVSAPFYLRVTDPSSNQMVNSYIASTFNYFPIPCLEPGVYKVQFVPANTPSVSLSFSYLNGNRRTLTAITNNSFTSMSFVADHFDYAKYRVRLNKGQILSVPSTSAAQLTLVLANSRGRTVASLYGQSTTPFQISAPATDDYYLFLRTQNLVAVNYSGTFTISP